MRFKKTFISDCNIQAMARFTFVLLLFVLLIISHCHGENILVAYPIASYEMQFLMRNVALVLAEKGHYVTVLSEDKSKLLKHPKITNHVLDLSPSMVYSRSCSQQMEEFVGCQKGIDIIDSVNKFWRNRIVHKLYQRKKSFGALVTPSAYNEVCFPFVYESNRRLILLRSLTGDLVEEISFLHMSNDNAMPLESTKPLQNLLSRTESRNIQSVNELRELVSRVYKDYINFIRKGISRTSVITGLLR